jgi:hypothetical protein
MLFDLQGKRRRTVQGTYLALAILMGGGLVFFGVGGAGGGLFGGDSGSSGILGGGSGGNKGDQVAKNKIKAANRTLATQPKNEAAYLLLISSHYTLATANADQNSNFLPQARPELLQTTQAWQRYLATNPPKPSLRGASFATQAYLGLASLSKDAASQKLYAGGLTDTYLAITQTQPTLNNFVRLFSFAKAAGKVQIAKRAENRALSLVPASKRKALKKNIEAPPSSAQAEPQPVPGTAGK